MTNCTKTTIPINISIRKRMNPFSPTYMVDKWPFSAVLPSESPSIRLILISSSREAMVPAPQPLLASYSSKEPCKSLKPSLKPDSKLPKLPEFTRTAHVLISVLHKMMSPTVSLLLISTFTSSMWLTNPSHMEPQESAVHTLQALLFQTLLFKQADPQLEE